MKNGGDKNDANRSNLIRDQKQRNGSAWCAQPTKKIDIKEQALAY